MNITYIEPIAIVVGLNEKLTVGHFGQVNGSKGTLWCHLSDAPWRTTESVDLFTCGLVLITPGEVAQWISIDKNNVGDIDTSVMGEQVIKGVYVPPGSDSLGVEFYISILVGGIDYNPASSFPSAIDDFGPLKVPAMTSDLPAIDYYQYLLSTTTKSESDYARLKSLKETLTPKMILAKDINRLRNAINATQKVYLSLKNIVDVIRNDLNELTVRVGIAEGNIAVNTENIAINAENIEENRKAIEAIHNEYLPNAIWMARRCVHNRVFGELRYYGCGTKLTASSQDPREPSSNPARAKDIYTAFDYSNPTGLGGSNINTDESFVYLVTNTSGSDYGVMSGDGITFFSGTPSGMQDNITAGALFDKNRLFVSMLDSYGEIVIGQGLGGVSGTTTGLMLNRDGASASMKLMTEANLPNTPGIVMRVQESQETLLALIGSKVLISGLGTSARSIIASGGNAVYQTYGYGSGESPSKQGFATYKHANRGAGMIFQYEHGDQQTAGILFDTKGGVNIWSKSGKIAFYGIESVDDIIFEADANALGIAQLIEGPKADMYVKSVDLSVTDTSNF